MPEGEGLHVFVFNSEGYVTNLRTLSLVLIFVGLVVAGVVLGVYPDIDLRVAAFFFDPDKTRFTWAANPVIVSLRNLNSAIDIAFGVAIAIALLQMRLRPGRPPLMSRRTAVFLLATFLLAPVFFANVVFKE